MITSYYDVVLLGTDLPALAAGALLSKRGFRVLALGQQHPGWAYRVGPYTLPRGPNHFVSAHSPAAKRVLSELALHPMLRRRSQEVDPSMQMVLPGHRVDLALDEPVLGAEIEREFPNVRRAVDDFHRYVQHAHQAVDRLLGRDMSLPPDTFLDRRELARMAATLPFDRHGEAVDPLNEIGAQHPFRVLMESLIRMSSDADPDHLCTMARVRLYGHWLKGVASLDEGHARLEPILIDSIRAHGGDVRIDERADRILVKRGTVHGVRLAESGQEIGTGFVLGGGELSELLRLLPDRRPFEELFERLGEPRVRYFRYTLNLVVKAEALPVGMSRQVFQVLRPEKALSSDNLLHVEVQPSHTDALRVLCVTTLLPRRSVENASGYLEQMRETLITSLESTIPFLREHLLLVDSPHDGRGPLDVQTGEVLSPEHPWSRGPGTMGAVLGYPVWTSLGVSAFPVRMPVRRFLLCNRQVVPALGEEGAFVTAWSAARLVTRAEKRRTLARRGLWSAPEV